MAEGTASRRVNIIVATAAVTLAAGGMAALYPTVPRGVVIWLVLFAILPIWAIVQGIDRWVFSSARFGALPAVGRTAIVIALSLGVAVSAFLAVLAVLPQ